MAAEFSFVAGDERIEIKIIKFENSSAGKQKSVDSLDSTVSLHIGAFSGSFKATFATQDLAVLHEQLISALVSGASTVSFRNLEGDLVIGIEFNTQGGGIITGTIQPHRLPQATLIFRLDIAQSSLVRTAQELEDALRDFPNPKQ